MTGITNRRHAVIAGAGIGGLSCALALRARGWKVTVVERAGALGDVGAGVQISPTGSKILDALGVLPRLQGQMVEHEAVEMRDGVTEDVIFHLSMGAHARVRWGAPIFQIHRGDLQHALAAQLESVAPGALRLGCGVDRYEHRENGAALIGESGVFEGDLVVGADGLHSALRSQMEPDFDPVYAGLMAWRALVPVDDLPQPPPKPVCVWVGKGRHAVTTHVRAGSLVNFVGVVDRAIPHSGEWDIAGPSADALKDFADFAPVIRDVIASQGRLMRWGLYDCAPLPRWHDGHAILIGDAAHPMVPSMAQGAVQAIEDGWELARQLEHSPCIKTALAWTYATRIRHVSRIQRLSRDNARLFHQRESLRGALSYGAAKLAGRVAPQLLRRRFDWIYRRDINDMPDTLPMPDTPPMRDG